MPLPPLDQPIPNDRNHLHFGLGQTEAIVELPPGKHTLQLLMGDADHVPHDPAVDVPTHHHLRPGLIARRRRDDAVQSRSRATLKPFSR